MVTIVTTQTIPLASDADGVLRVGGTRVTLDTIVAAYMQGATAEEIAQNYPVLDIADVYAVIGYYLHNSQALDAYLRQGEAQALAVRAESEARWDPVGVRARLLARRPQAKPPQ